MLRVTVFKEGIVSRIDTVRAILSAIEALDYAKAMPLVGESVRDINEPKPEVTGHQGVLEYLEPFFAPTEENIFDVERAVESSNQVFVQRLDKHRFPQGWFERPVTGVFEVENAKTTC